MQAATLLVCHGVPGIQRRSSIQKAHLSLDHAGEEETVVDRPEEELSGRSAGHRVATRGRHSVPAILNIKEEGIDLWLGSSTPGLWPMFSRNMPCDPVKSLLFSGPQFPFQFKEALEKLVRGLPAKILT